MNGKPMLAALLALVAACGDGGAETARRPEESSSAVAIAPAASAPAATPLAATVVPAAFVSACVSGDPVAGIPRAVTHVDLALAPLPLESIETLPSRDSARLAARLSRAADVLPSDTTVADFRGLPVSVRAAWRFASAPGDTIVVALVGRRLPMESNPLEELFFVVAAPGQRQGVRDPLVERWVVREVASEESIVVRELLAAFMSDSTLTLVVAHEEEDGVRAELISRRAGMWRIDWSGLLPLCAP